jgi:hypothetical protein
MDETRGPTVGELLPALKKVESAVKDELKEDPEVKGLTLAWSVIGSELEGALRSVLDCDALELLGQAWAAADALQAYADPALHAPGEAAIVELGAHDFVREIHPVVTVTIGSCASKELRFTISLAAHFGGVALSIRDGHVTGGRTGDASVSAELKYGEILLHEAGEAKKMALPGRFAFAAPGLPIRRAAGGKEGDGA